MPMAMRKGVEVRRAPMVRNFFFSDFFSVGAGDLGLAAGGTDSSYRQENRNLVDPEAVQDFSVRGRQGSPTYLRRLHPAAGNSRGWITSNENSRPYQVASVGVTNFGAWRSGRATHDRGEEMKALPTTLGVVFSQPDFAVPFWQENIFSLKGGGRF